MSNRTPRGVPGETLRDLGLPARAVSALTRAGVESAADLAALTRRELAGIAGLGPGSIAAIRAVVPEPHAPATANEDTADEEESPDAPAIPSFDSLRSPQRRTALDLLVPAADPMPAADLTPAADPTPGPSPAAEIAPAAEPAPAAQPSPAAGPSRGAGAAPAGQPRPAEYADLLRWGVHLAVAAAELSLRVMRWSVRAPLRRLLGD